MASLKEEIGGLLNKVPFEPFRIKLVNGDFHDVFDPQTLAVQGWILMIASPDQNWVTFPIDKINSIESLIADYHGEAAKASGPEVR